MHTMLCLACMSGVYILQRPRQVPVRQHQDLSDVYKVHAALSLCQHQNLSDIYKVHAALSLCQVSAFCSVLDKDLSDRTKTSEVDITPLLIILLHTDGPRAGASVKAGGWINGWV